MALGNKVGVYGTIRLRGETMIKPTVFGEGPPNAKIVLIGEAPGKTESIQHRPFVGNAGIKLTNLLHSEGISRNDVYLTNVLKERPKVDDNDISEWFQVKRNGTVITSPDYNEYIAMLRIELQRMSDACVFVPLGNVPLYALTGLTAITKRRGSILEGNFWPGMKVIPTIHPRAAIDEPLFDYYIRIDLRKILRESQSKEIKLPTRYIVVRPSINQINGYLETVKDGDIIGNDIEVVNEELSCMSFAETPTDAISIPLADIGKDYLDPNQELSVIRKIGEKLANPNIKKIGQNYIFDLTFMYRKYRIIAKNYEDTMIAMGILFPDFPKGLDFITSIYTDEPYYKDDGKKWFKYGGSIDRFWLYNAKDSIICREAWPKLEAELKRQGNWETYRRHVKLIEPLIYMQDRGFRMDVDGLKKASAEALEKINEIYNELHECCGFPLNINSPKQVAEYFYTKLGHQPYTKYNKRTRSSHVTTDVDAMKRLARKGVKEAKLVLDIRKWSKLKNTYLDANLDKDYRLRSAMNPIGTKNGRLSSSEDIFGVGMNVQNMPKAFKKFVCADEGYMIFEFDLSQGENRVVAYVAPEPLMMEAFEQKKDVHSLTASFFFGIPYDEVKQMDKEKVMCPLGNGDQTHRYWGKKGNHGLNYDLGYKSFALKYELPENQAKVLVDRYHQIYPGVRQMHAWIRAKLANEGHALVNPYGRKRVFLGRWGDELFKKAYNFIPQSVIADKINEEGINYIYYNQQDFEAVELLNQVHDSIVFQINYNKHSFEEMATILIKIKRSLETPVPWKDGSFVIPVDCKAGFNLKDMEEVKVKGIEETTKELLNIYNKLKIVTSKHLEEDLDDIVLQEEL